MSGHVIIPAAPGFYALRETNTGELMHGDAVVAWALDLESEVARTITANGDVCLPSHLLHPDGRVSDVQGAHVPGSGTWASLADANSPCECAARVVIRNAASEWQRAVSPQQPGGAK